MNSALWREMHSWSVIWWGCCSAVATALQHSLTGCEMSESTDQHSIEWADGIKCIKMHHLSGFGEADQPEVSAGHHQVESSYKRWESLERWSPEWAHRPAGKNNSHWKKSHEQNPRFLYFISKQQFQPVISPDRDVQCGSATRCLELIGWVGLTGMEHLGVLGWIGFGWSCRTSRPRWRRKEQEMEVRFPHLQRRPLYSRSLPPCATALNPHCLRGNKIIGIRNII